MYFKEKLCPRNEKRNLHKFSLNGHDRTKLLFTLVSNFRKGFEKRIISSCLKVKSSTGKVLLGGTVADSPANVMVAKVGGEFEAHFPIILRLSTVI